MDERTREQITVDNLEVPPALRQLYGYLVDRGCIVQLTDFNRDYLGIYSHDVLGEIDPHNTEWESMAPPGVAAVIKARGLFGYAQGAEPQHQRTAV